jgi:hypothetical protein
LDAIQGYGGLNYRVVIVSSNAVDVEKSRYEIVGKRILITGQSSITPNEAQLEKISLPRLLEF